ncbi:hypothetical protein Y1Q_0024532 [Alligator mississippiensis]|uniref:Uncharacterized protein n=1 Tax=Alligator mississippiensis TaxID=8496 RepID=A0A151NBB6_ALLMI|nr:hypothetical protein Y1Q_0024532 [Alligator mississippiensis]
MLFVPAQLVERGGGSRVWQVALGQKGSLGKLNPTLVQESPLSDSEVIRKVLFAFPKLSLSAAEFTHQLLKNKRRI